MGLKVYRTGPMGALLDEYEKAIDELKLVLISLDNSKFKLIVDNETNDPDCVSIQSIMIHVIRSGYGYANYIRSQFGVKVVEDKNNYLCGSGITSCNELDKMFLYNDETLQSIWNISNEELIKNVIKTRWGQLFDVDQLLEHAIVHILRHRRQINKFKSLLN